MFTNVSVHLWLSELHVELIRSAEYMVAKVLVNYPIIAFVWRK